MLGDHETSGLMDSDEAETSIGPGSGQDDAGGACPIGLCQRMEQGVEGQAQAVRLGRHRDVKPACLERQRPARRDDIQVPGRDVRSVQGFEDGERRMIGEQLDQQALVGRIEMLDEDQGEVRPVAERVEKSAAGVETAGGRADGDHEIARRRFGFRRP